MQRLLRPAVVMAVLATAGGLMIAPVSSESPSPTPEVTPTAADTPSPTPSPSPSPPQTPSPTPALTSAPGGWVPPAGYPGNFRPDTRVRITGTDFCLNARTQPGLAFPAEQGGGEVPVLNCLPDGFIGTITARGDAVGTLVPPVLADGHWWWYLLGQGWVAEDWVAPAGEVVPEAVDNGLIAFARDGGVWLMNADGTDQRLVHAIDIGAGQSVGSLAWSSDGAKLAVGIESWTTTYSSVTRIIATDGTVLAEYPFLTRASWAPVGPLLAGLKAVPVSADPTRGYLFRPIVVSIESATETSLGFASPNPGEGPVWSPVGDSLALVCYGSTWETVGSDGLPQRMETLCEGGDGLHIVPAAGGPPLAVVPLAYSQVSWSPAGTSIAVLSGGQGSSCSGYLIVSPASAAATGCLAIPNNGTLSFACGGTALSPGDWSSDGRRFAYHAQSAVGQNGIVITDIPTGAEVRVPSLYATSVEFSPDDSQVLFGADGQVWVAGAGGSFPVHLADGRMPTWQPVP